MAFDTVNHSVLLAKIKHLQMPTDAIQWFKSYLEERQQCVKVNGEKSQFLTKQHGSTTGFNTWTVYLSDLLLSCPGVSCQMNTDDTVMYASA